jgi:hypothetical protein
MIKRELSTTSACRGFIQCLTDNPVKISDGSVHVCTALVSVVCDSRGLWLRGRQTDSVIGRLTVIKKSMVR